LTDLATFVQPNTTTERVSRTTAAWLSFSPAPGPPSWPRGTPEIRAIYFWVAFCTNRRSSHRTPTGLTINGGPHKQGLEIPFVGLTRVSGKPIDQDPVADNGEKVRMIP
jgi:hypothetical protein